MFPLATGFRGEDNTKTVRPSACDLRRPSCEFKQRAGEAEASIRKLEAQEAGLQIVAGANTGRGHELPAARKLFGPVPCLSLKQPELTQEWFERHPADSSV